MAQFLDLFGFVSVLLRGTILSLGSMAVGGVIFSLFIRRRSEQPPSAKRLLTFSAFSLAAVQLLYVISNSTILSATTDLRFTELVGAAYFVWGCASAFAALTLGMLSARIRSPSKAWEIASAFTIMSATVATSHAAARLDHQLILITATAGHQLATAAWIGGLPFLLLTIRNCSRTEAAVACRLFSKLALLSVPLLFAAGMTLSFFYIGRPSALYGTTYGLMVSAKAILFALLLCLGALNFRLIRGNEQSGAAWLSRLAKISEAEIGIGLTVLLAAASLTSQPPAADLANNRLSLSTIRERMTPQLPRMHTPPALYAIAFD